MVASAYLLKKIDFKACDEEFIIKKIFNKNPSFNLNDEKIVSLFDCGEFNSNELVMDSSTWEDILKNSKFDDYELAIVNQISKDLSGKDMVIYELF